MFRGGPAISGGKLAIGNPGGNICWGMGIVRFGPFGSPGGGGMP
jgi:hypothetical protein